MTSRGHSFLGFVPSLRAILPLPEGAGRGEGKALVQTTRDHRVTPRRWSSFSLYTLAFSLLFAPAARAFPPAPNAVIYGLVKDQYGTPLPAIGDQIILQTASGVQVAGYLQPGLAIGVNYSVQVPMDAGTFGGPYSSTALLAATQYKLYVVTGTTTNLPIEMAGNYLSLGSPASQTRQNLTLGTDANGDGIPDQWETLFLAELGVNLPLSSINPNTDYAHNGRTLKQEYLLGNYPYNPADNFNVQIVSQNGGSAVLSFTTMTGRTYSVFGSSDLQSWTPLAFTVSSTGPASMTSFYAPTIQPMQIQTVQPSNGPVMQFYRMELQ